MPGNLSNSIVFPMPGCIARMVMIRRTICRAICSLAVRSIGVKGFAGARGRATAFSAVAMGAPCCRG
jgi:hypothetical protein